MSTGPFSRLTAPLIVVSVLLLGVGIGAAFYVHSMQQNTSEIVTNHVASVRAAYELETSIREVRTHLNRYMIDGNRKHLESVPRLRERTDYWLKEAERLGATPAEQELMRRVRSGYEHFFGEYERLTNERPPQGMYGRISELLDGVFTKEILEPAQSYAKLNEGALTRASEVNRETGNWLIFGLVGIGICGAVGGLLVGWVIAASVRRSMDQTREQLLNTAEQLHRAAGLSMASTPPEELDAALHTMTASVAAVIERLDRSQRDALRAEQLAWVGQMAAGIAHEVRNPLMAIKLLVQNAGERRRGEPFRPRDLEVLEEEINRVEQIVGHFLEFARPPRIQKRTVEARPLLERVTGSLSARAELQDVRLHCSMPDGPFMLDVDAGQIQQLLYNLIVNALDAQPTGGNIRIAVCRETRHPETPPEAVIRIEDEGPGMPAELGERIFEPFVSTKDSGMGLGLSICRRIVEAHGGSIRAANRGTGGAVFTVRLPLVVQKSPVAVH